jgi:hypothetical protein
MGKSALVPLSGWLPRAMEGPTPSSAVFYGALSIHLGPYLLLRAAPIFERSVVATVAIAAIGALTALHATFVGRVQTDVKSALAYASMTQVGLIVAGIGVGSLLDGEAREIARDLTVIHIAGHASIRTLQLLRAPTQLHDHHPLERAMGRHLPRTGVHLERVVPARLQPWLYMHALERGYFDALLADRLVGAVVRFLRRVDHLEERWVALLAGAEQADPRLQESAGAPGVTAEAVPRGGGRMEAA